MANNFPDNASCVSVIDDDPVQRDLMQRFLSKEGFYVRTAAGGDAGLRLDLSAKERRRLSGSVESILQKASGSREALLKQGRDLVAKHVAGHKREEHG